MQCSCLVSLFGVSFLFLFFTCRRFRTSFYLHHPTPILHPILHHVSTYPSVSYDKCVGNVGNFSAFSGKTCACDQRIPSTHLVSPVAPSPNRPAMAGRLRDGASLGNSRCVSLPSSHGRTVNACSRKNGLHARKRGKDRRCFGLVLCTNSTY